MSLEGGGLSESAVEKRVRKRTATGGRKPVSPHLFRTCAATTVAVDAPTEVDLIPGFLNHTTPSTAESFYIVAGNLEASRAQAGVVEALRRTLEQEVEGKNMEQDSKRPRRRRGKE